MRISEQQVDEILTTPTSELIQFIATVRSPLLILGAGGKMGPTLAVMAKRAAAAAGRSLEVIAVSRFTNDASRRWLEERQVQTITCDLLDRVALSRLPDSEEIIYLVGLKFGTAKQPSLTWAMNTIVPANVMERYGRSRIVALSTGNVYPFTPAQRGGASEDHPLTPLGEYANAAIARERLFEFFAARQGTPVALIRLFYAVEFRYGILVDLAQHIISGEPIDLTNGYFNCIWQPDANDMILRSLALASNPPAAWNLCQPTIFNVRDVASDLGELLGVAPLFKSNAAENALLGNSGRICSALGTPPTPLKQMLTWIADWLRDGGSTLGKPTHFEVRDGAY